MHFCSLLSFVLSVYGAVTILKTCLNLQGDKAALSVTSVTDDAAQGCRTYLNNTLDCLLKVSLNTKKKIRRQEIFIKQQKNVIEGNKVFYTINIITV